MKKYLFSFLIISLHTLNGSLQLTSPAFTNNGMIPEKYTCDGSNISPRLEWSGAPTNTQSFALIMEDPDALEKVWVHWLLFNIPATVNFLPENTTNGSFMNGSTDFHGSLLYGGPCPPSGTHHYQFTLFALDTVLDLIQQGANKEYLIKAIHNHVLDQTTLTGKYQSKK